MAIPLPPDPYKALGVEPTAPEGDIRKIYLKLVLKCHPDKIQDPTLKAQKVDEFHKIQEAWDLLSDKAKRADYDEKVKINARAKTTRSGMRGSVSTDREYREQRPPPSRGYFNFEYEIRTAEPRSAKFRKEAEFCAANPTRPRSYEDEIGGRHEEDPRPRRDMGYDYTTPKPTSRSSGRRRAEEEEDDRRRARSEKESKRKDQSDAKKSRDKDRRRGTEEKTRTKHSAFIVEDNSDEIHTSSRDRSGKSVKPSKSKKSDERLEDGLRHMQLDTPTKDSLRLETAMRYQERARNKAAPPSVPTPRSAVQLEEARPRGMPRRAETFNEYSSPPLARTVYVEDDDIVRRSSARRRGSEDVSSPRSRRAAESVRVNGVDADIIEAIPSQFRKPSLATHNSAPPIIPGERERAAPSRSQTIHTELPRRSSSSNVPPQPTRAQTFHGGAGRSKLSQRYKAGYSDISDSSESDIEYKPAPRRPAYTESRPSVQKVYQVGPTSAGVRVRKAMKEESVAYSRDRSPSPRSSRRGAERPSLSTRSTQPTRTSSSRYHDEPLSASQREPFGGISGVRYAQRYDPAKVSYSPYATSERDMGSAYAYHTSSPTQQPRREHVGAG